MQKPALFLLCAAIGVKSSAFGGLIIPSSYTATPGEVGGYTYYDDTGRQLTDGVFGVNDWSADLGNGPAYEWVGWFSVNPTFTFDFASSVTVDKVLIDFSRSETPGGPTLYGNIHLPTDVNINGTSYSLAGNEIPDYTRGTIEFAGSWTGSTLTVTLSHRWWLFVDEVQFNEVPEPGAYGLVAALGLINFGALRRARCE